LKLKMFKIIKNQVWNSSTKIFNQTLTISSMMHNIISTITIKISNLFWRMLISKVKFIWIIISKFILIRGSMKICSLLMIRIHFKVKEKEEKWKWLFLNLNFSTIQINKDKNLTNCRCQWYIKKVKSQLEYQTAIKFLSKSLLLRYKLYYNLYKQKRVKRWYFNKWITI
jgi:hypothetical protein